MGRVNLFIALVLCVVSNCYSEVNVEEKDRLLNGFVDYLNNLPSQPYVYDDGVILSAQKTEENSYKIQARLKATEIHNVDSVRYLKCTATIVDHQENRYSVKNDEYFCENAESNGDVVVGRYEEVVPDPSTVEPPVQYRPVQLDNEVQPNNEATSGEQFVAISREEPIRRAEARCIGCGSQVDVDAPGVSELAALGVRHLDMHESNVKHSLNRIVEVQRQVQVVNGVRYILTLLIDYNNCTETETEACSFTQPCKVSVLEKPWLKLPNGAKYRAIVSNNCTNEWLFGDNGEMVPEKPEDDKAVDDILKAIHNTDLQSQQESKSLSEDDMKKIDEQIIPHNRFHDSHITLDAVTETSVNDDISKQHNVEVESVNHNNDNLDIDTHSSDTARPISEDKKKAIDELMNFFDFAGFNSNRDRREYIRMKRSFDFDLQILSLAQKFKKIKDNITNAKYVYSIAQSMIDYLNEMDMEENRRMLKDVVAAEEESDNDQNYMYLQARVVIPCEKSKCENERTISNICNGVIDTTHKQTPQILTTFCYEEKKKMSNFGKVHVVPLNDPILQKLINRAIKKIESESAYKNAIKVINIMDAIIQKESSTLTKISAELAYTNCSKTTSFPSRINCTVLEYLGSKLCNIDIFERYTLKEMKITYICNERPLDESFTNKVQLNNSIENMNNPKIMEMVQDALQYLEIQSNRNNKQKVVEVKSVTTQIIAGLLTTIDFVVAYTKCSNEYEVNENKCNILEKEKLRNCRAHIWHRPWLEYGKQINVTCNDEQSLNDVNIAQYRSKRSLHFVSDKEYNLNLGTRRKVGLLGGRVDKDPNDSYYTKLAEDSLQKYVQTSGATQEHKIVKVDKVTVQIVSGTLTRLYFTVTRGPENSGDVIKCHSEVWEQPWLNKTQIDVKCKVSKQKSRIKREVGLVGGQVDKDPSDSRYKKLAEESLQKYLQTSGTTQQHKIVKVDKVTVQVVSGSLTRLDFTVTRGAENSGDVIKCHSKVWEQPWLNKTQIDVNCEINNQNLRSKRQTGLPGGRVDKDPNDSRYKKLAEDSLQKYLETSGTTQQHKIVKVDKVTVQVVSGTLTRLDFTVTRGAENSGDVIKCHSEVWEQPWLNKTQIDVKCDIDNENLRSKRQTGLPGGREDKDPNDSRYKKLAEDSLQKYLETSGTTQQHKIIKVDKVTVQVVSGTLTRLDFTVTRGAENSGDVIKCHSEVWEQSWLNKTQIDVKCEINNHNLRSKRQVGLKGGREDKDPNDSRYKKLAEDSLQKYLETSGSTQQHKIVKVDKVTVQVVSGTLTRLDFTVTRGPENSGDVIKCHSEVWAQPWLNKTQIDVKCDIDNENLRSKRQTGLPGGREDKDPNDSRYKKLAEDSLQKYLETSGTTQQHKIVKVDKVTVQVVSGTLTRLDFTVTRGPENSGDVIKCHSEVWEQPWLNKTQIDVKCDIDNENLRSKRQTGLPGGREDKDPNDSRYKKLAEDSLQKYLETSGTTQQHKIVKVDKVTVQVVSGTLTRLDFTVTRGAENSGDVIKCHSEVWEQSWLNKTQIDVKCEINNQNLRSKRQAGLPGGRVDKDPNDSRYKKLAEDSLQKYLETSGTTQQHKIVKVDKVTVQVVSGSLTRLDFTVTRGAENSGDVIKCHSEVWEQPWLNKTQIDVKCEINDQNLRSKRQAGLPGGRVDKDPNDSHYKKLAEDSLQKYLETSGTTQQHKIVKVDKVTVQVVSGSLTRLDFTVTRGAENSGDVIKCHSEVWEQSWLNKTQIDVKCEINNQNLRSKRQVGLKGGRVDKDPNDSRYKKLAEDSLQKYLETSGTTQQHKIVKVDKVTVQVVSGTLTRLDFTVTRGPENSGDVIKCHSEVWEQPWLNKTQIDVKCDIDNENLRSKRQTGLPGGREDKDPNDSRYKKLAEDSLQKYLETSGTTQQYKIVKVDKVTVQVVSGTLTRLDFTVTRGAENSGDVIKCHSEVWEQSWLNKTQIDVKCEINNQNLRSKRQAGLPGGRVDKDPNDSRYKKLAEDSLQKYLETSGTTQQHKIVKVDKVTVQVVSGSLTRLDFTVTRGAENSGDVIKCHSEVWEQPWLNKTQIDVKCEINDQNLRSKRQAGLPGGRVDKDPNDSHYKKLAEDSLQKYLETSGTTQQHKIVKVDKVTVQVVSGTLTRLDFTVTRGAENSGDVIKCHSEVWEQSWLNKTQIDVKCEINNQNLRSKRQAGLPGGRVDKDPNDSRYKKLAEDSLQKYLETSGTTQQHKIVKVDKVTVQVVSGSLTRLDFTVTRGAENSGDVIKCHSEVWEQPWLNKTQIDVKCEINDQNLRSKRQAGLPGGRVDKDPNDSHYKKLAEDSLQKYLETSGTTQQHKIVKVDKVTVQVVSGSLTRLDFTVTRGAENSGDVIKCHSEVWEQPWLNKTQIDVKCEINNQNLRSKRQAGLPGGRVDKDPNDSRYKKLAEDSLQKYLETSGTTQQHKIVKVDKVTVQVVSGTLTRLDFTVTRGAENSGDVIKCHSEVWEQSWLNKTQIDVKCEINNQNLRSKRQAGLPGGRVDKDPNDSRYKKLAEDSLQKYLETSGTTQQHKIVKVDKVTVQVVSGSLTRLDFTVTRGAENSGDVIKCHSEVWEQPWLNKTQIDVKCEINDQNLRSKRQAGLPGGRVDKDPNDSHYKKLAEDSLQKYLETSGTTQQHKIVKVDKVTVQVVSGSLTRLDFTVTRGAENSGDVIKCHSEVWEQPWLNKTQIDVKCEINNQNLRSKRQAGLPGGRVDQDLNDSRYKKLAEDSLQKYLEISGATQQHKIVKVDKVTVQVVSGTLTSLDFTVTRGAENSGDVIKCHSEVWEQSWLNKTQIDVKCEISNQNLRSKRQSGLPGGRVDKDPNDSRYKKLAEDSLQKYLQTSGTTQQHKIVKVDKVTVQVVSGTLTRLDFTVTRGAENSGDVIKCHSEVWEQLWLNKTQIDVKCEISNQNLRGKRQTVQINDGKTRLKRKVTRRVGIIGGIVQQDPSNLKYKLLAEESLVTYQQLQGSQNKYVVLEVTKVTTQVVAGIIYHIHYTATKTSCIRKNVDNSACEQHLQCHAKIWDKPNAGKDIKVSCRQFNSLPNTHIDENNVEEDMKYYYSERAVQQMNDHSDTDNLYKLISVHSMHVSTHMYAPLVRMYIETALTYCLRHQDDHDLASCEEMDGLNHRLCHARLYLSPDDEHVVQQVSVVCDDDPNFSSVTGLSIPELLKASINEIERSPDVGYKMIHQGEPYVIPSLDSTKPIKMSFVVAYTNCSKNININDPKNVCFIDSLRSSMACNSKIYVVPNSREIERVIVSCKRPSLPRLKRSITLDNGNVTTDDLEIQNLVNQALEKLEMVSLHRYKQRVLKINSFSSKITSGKVTTIDFDVGYTACLKYEWIENVASCQVLDHLPRRHCVAQIYERLWINNGKNIDVNCEDDETAPETHIEFESAELAMQLAKQALKHVEAKYPHPREQKVVRVFTLEKQVIAGLHYRLKMEVGFTNCTALSNKKDCVVGTDSGQNKFCRVNVWIRPWTDHAPNFRVSCDYQANLNTEIYRHVQAEHLFYDFLATYKPEYINDQAEMIRRFKIFEKNIEKIHFLNTHEQGTATYAVTRFADLSYEEFTSKYLGLKPSLKNDNDIPMTKAVIPKITIPEKFDWRDHDAVTEVKNQGSCGSCWAFSVIGNIEGQWKMQSGELVSLSEQELVDCDKLDQGCNGGLPDNAYRAIEQLGGLELEKDYPYEGEDDKCSFNRSMARVQISGAVNITSNETDMAKWLVQNGPISIGINANAMQFYVGGVSHPWKMLCNPKNLDHGVLIVGYGIKDYPLFNKKLPYWTIKNSWGKFWGEQGYYRVYRGDGTCGVNQMASSAII